MIAKAHESLAYQEFLISELRENVIPPQVYLDILPERIDYPIRLLDFGCGMGYVSLLLGDALRNHEGSHIFACDYQEDLLDIFWKKIVQRKLNNITPFFLPDRSLIFFPRWIPPIDHLIFSFSLSAVDDGFKIFQTIKSALREDAMVHIIDWEHDAKNEIVNRLFPPEDRLTAMILQQWLELTGYKVEQVDSGKKDYFYIRAQLFMPN